MKRRLFLKHSLITTLSAAMAPPALFGAANKANRFTILHTNDMHSRVEPFPLNDGRFPGMGGMAKRASLINQFRKSTENILLLDSGDIFQGTPYFNFFGGEVEFKLMSQMGYDAATIGNHDFDAGLEGLNKQLPHATFQFISANYDFSKTIMNDAVVPYKIFKKGKIKVGVFGLGVQLENLVSKELYGDTKYFDPVGVTTEMVSELEPKCDLIICLSHLGYKYESSKISDISLAEQVNGIDIILGGHSHTFLDEPTLIKNGEGHQTIINQVGFGGIRLGKIEFSFEKGKRVVGGYDMV
ncbi:MAG: metallophosphatase [Cyclobacteriaceae bacterium]